MPEFQENRHRSRFSERPDPLGWKAVTVPSIALAEVPPPLPEKPPAHLVKQKSDTVMEFLGESRPAGPRLPQKTTPLSTPLRGPRTLHAADPDEFESFSHRFPEITPTVTPAVTPTMTPTQLEILSPNSQNGWRSSRSSPGETSEISWMDVSPTASRRSSPIKRSPRYSRLDMPPLPPMQKTPTKKPLPMLPIDIRAQSSPVLNVSTDRNYNNHTFGALGRGSSPIRDQYTPSSSPSKSWTTPSKIYRKLSSSPKKSLQTWLNSKESLNDTLTSVSLQSFDEDASHMESGENMAEIVLQEEETGFQLPELPFSASSLTEMEFSQCNNAVFLSEIFLWCQKIPGWCGWLLLKKSELEKAVCLLFKFHFPKCGQSMIDSNAAVVLRELETSCAILVDASGIVTMDGAKTASGVLMMKECYSPKCSSTVSSTVSSAVSRTGTCYACTCHGESRDTNLRLVQNQNTNKGPLGKDWVTHWDISNEELSEIGGSEIKRQSHIFDLIKSEQRFLQSAKVMLEVYGETFLNHTPPLLPDVKKFYNDAFGTLKPLMDAHREFLYEPFMARLNNQGKFISSFSSFYLSWINHIKTPYLRYAERMVSVRDLILYETKTKKGSPFAQWLTETDKTPRVLQLGVSHDRLFSTSFINHILQLPLTLTAVLEKTLEQDSDYANLCKVLKTVKRLSAKIDEMQAYAFKVKALKHFKSQLIWKSGLEVELGLDSDHRQLVKKGDVFRRKDIRDMKLNDSSTDLVLLDNYLLICERVSRDGHRVRESAKDESATKYKVTERPIPIEYLMIETKETKADRIDRRRSTGDQVKKSLEEVETDYFPFKIKSQTHSYTFYTNTEMERNAWLASLSEVQSSLAKKVRKIEPFKLEVMAEVFQYEPSSVPHATPMLPPDNPVDLALKRVEEGVPRPVMVSKVLSGASFTHQNLQYSLVGLNFGVFMTIRGQSRSWVRVLELPKVTQIQVLHRYNVILLISDKTLKYYYIPPIVSTFGGQECDRVGVRLSKQDVSFFTVGKHRGVDMVFFMKPKTAVSSFKVIIPIVNDTGTLDYFQEHKRFLVPSECFGVTVFNSTFVVHTAKGFEVMSLSIPHLQTIPTLTDSNDYTFARLTSSSKKSLLDSLKKRLSNSKPLSVYKLENELLLVYGEFAVFTDRHGRVTRDNYIQFHIKGQRCALQENCLVVASDEACEVWRIGQLGKFDNRLLQVIQGKQLIMVDESPVKLVMVHPKIPGRQLLLELCDNDFLKR